MTLEVISAVWNLFELPYLMKHGRNLLTWWVAWSLYSSSASRFIQLCSNWQDFKWHCTSRSVSTIVEFLMTGSKTTYVMTFPDICDYCSKTFKNIFIWVTKTLDLEAFTILWPLHPSISGLKILLAFRWNKRFAGSHIFGLIPCLSSCPMWVWSNPPPLSLHIPTSPLSTLSFSIFYFSPFPFLICFIDLLAFPCFPILRE